tara:strand:- start:1358 stop:1741 length:384 start_codon:yes stop_codon:yes gene_type:complete
MNNIDKILESKGDLEETKRLADLEKIEFDVMQNLADTIKEDFEREKKKGQTLIDWMKSKPTSYFKRIKLSGGGKVINFSDYFKSKEPKIKEIDLASHFKFGKTLSSLTDAEKEVVNNLLRMSLGKKD